MSLITVRYRFDDKGNLIPLCEVTLLGKNKRVVVPALVDSGATHPVFRLADAEDAGIDLRTARPMDITFGGSKVRGKLANAFIEIEGQRFEVGIVFVPEIMLGYALLGRKTFFTQLNEVAFIERTRDPRFELRG